MTNAARSRRSADGSTPGKRGRPESLVRQYWEDINEAGVGPKCSFCNHRSQTRVFRAPPATRHTLICKNAPEDVKAQLRQVTNNKYSRRPPSTSSGSTSALGVGVGASTGTGTAASSASPNQHRHEDVACVHTTGPSPLSRPESSPITSLPAMPEASPSSSPPPPPPPPPPSRPSPPPPPPPPRPTAARQSPPIRPLNHSEQNGLPHPPTQQLEQHKPLHATNPSSPHGGIRPPTQGRTVHHFTFRQTSTSSHHSPSRNNLRPSDSSNRHPTGNGLSDRNTSSINGPSPPPALPTTTIDSVGSTPLRPAMVTLDSNLRRPLSHTGTLSPGTTEFMYPTNQRLFTPQDDVQASINRANAALANAVVESLFTATSRKMEGSVPTPSEFRFALYDAKEAARAKAKRQRNEARAESGRLQQALSVLVASTSSFATTPLSRGVDTDSDESGGDLGNANHINTKREWPHP